MDKQLLALLVCPLTQSKLDYDAQHQELICRESGLAYPIKEGIPLMLVEQARVLEVEEKLGKPRMQPPTLSSES